MVKHLTNPKVEEWLECLRANGYRLTEPRRAVVETIALSQHVLSPFDVFEQARRNYPKLGLVTVYRTIEKLGELDLIQRVHQPSGCQAFIAAYSGQRRCRRYHKTITPVRLHLEHRGIEQVQAVKERDPGFLKA